MVDTCTVTWTARDFQFATLAGAQLVFMPRDALTLAGAVGVLYVPNRSVAVSDGAGAGSIALVPGYYVLHIITASGTATAGIAVPNEVTAPIGACIDQTLDLPALSAFQALAVEAAASAASAAASAVAAATFDPALYLGKSGNLAGLLNTTTALTNLGGTAVGRSVFAAVDAAAGQTALGGSAVGKAVFVAADAAAARTAIGAAIGTDVQAHDADLTALAAIVAVEGDIIYRGAAGWTRLAKGTSGQVLAQNAGLTAPEWASLAASGWAPYNTPSDGKYYDFATNGAVASVETPAFADGYEYMIIVESYAKGGTSASLQAELYREQAAAYGGVMSYVSNPGTAGVSGCIELPMPRRTMRSHFTDVRVAIDATNGNTGVSAVGTTNHTTATKIGKARLSWSGSPNSTAGRLYLYRRVMA